MTTHNFLTLKHFHKPKVALSADRSSPDVLQGSKLRFLSSDNARHHLKNMRYESDLAGIDRVVAAKFEAAADANAQCHGAVL